MKDPREISPTRQLIITIGFVFGCIMILALVAWTNSEALAVAGQATNPSVEAEKSLGISSDIFATSEKLTQKWLNQIGNEEWLFYSYKEELPGDNGVDPETNWPLPSQALWAAWYHFNTNKQPDIVLVQRTDTERGNVWQVAWTKGESLRYPSDVREEDPYMGDYYPIRDHYCTTRLQDIPNYADENTTIEVTDSWRTGDDGVMRWVMTLKIAYPPVRVSDDSRTYIATELTCVRNGETGAVELSEEVGLTTEGERILRSRHFDYIVKPVTELPVDMLSLLDKLTHP